MAALDAEADGRSPYPWGSSVTIRLGRSICSPTTPVQWLCGSFHSSWPSPRRDCCGPTSIKPLQLPTSRACSSPLGCHLHLPHGASSPTSLLPPTDFERLAITSTVCRKLHPPTPGLGVSIQEPDSRRHYFFVASFQFAPEPAHHGIVNNCDFRSLVSAFFFNQRSGLWPIFSAATCR